MPRWLLPTAVAGVAATAGVTLWLLPEATQLSPGCPFRALTGLDCPGCGGTRAALALTDGRVADAVSHNVLTVTLLPLFALLWSQWLQVTLGRRERVWTPSPPATWTLAGAFVGFWLLRNVPVWPLSWLGSAPV